MKMLTSIELTEAATKRFSDWVIEVSDRDLNIEAVIFEALDSFQESISNGEDEPMYELEKRLTWRKTPALFELKKHEYVTEYEDDGCDE